MQLKLDVRISTLWKEKHARVIELRSNNNRPKDCKHRLLIIEIKFLSGFLEDKRAHTLGGEEEDQEKHILLLD